MYTVEKLKEHIEEKNFKIETDELKKSLKKWKIDPVYEDENNTDFYDEFALIKLEKALKLKENGENEEEIINKLSENIDVSINAPSIVKTTVVHDEESSHKNEAPKITVDITTQTLAILADSISQKISSDITSKVKNSNIFEPAFESGKLKRDNEILSNQIEKLIKENKQLKKRINFLQNENTKYKHVFGNVYMKKE